jgi:hypothetical protein
MSWRFRDPLLALGGAILLVGSGLAVARHRRHAPVSTVSIPASASEHNPADDFGKPVPPGLNPIFDCAGLGPAPLALAACPAPPAAETQLLALANSYRVSVMPCSSWLSSADAQAALDAVANLNASDLAPLERAALQNAALELLSCLSMSATLGKNSKLSKSAKSVIAKLALSAKDKAQLPESTAVVGPWLGDSAGWLAGKDPRFFHTISDGFARAHHQIAKNGTFADVVRLVLVDKASKPFVSDIVERVVLRRAETDGIHVCIAELDPVSASCGPAGLVPLKLDRGARVLAGPPPCLGCHMNNLARAESYGPEMGLAVADASVTRIEEALSKTLVR